MGLDISTASGQHARVLTLAELIEKYGAAEVARVARLGRSYVYAMAKGDRPGSVGAFVRLRKAFPEFSADAELQAREG